MGPVIDADLHFRIPQRDANFHCETTDTVLVHHMVRVFASEPQLVLIYNHFEEKTF